VTGQLVFEARTAADMLLRHAQTPPTPPSQVSELPVPKEFDRIVMTCLEKNPESRFSSALEVDAQLARVPLPEPWTQARARDWWQRHAPELVAARRS
jgi:eukaryotic-like serine/threonine-protein kinase